MKNSSLELHDIFSIGLAEFKKNIQFGFGIVVNMKTKQSIWREVPLLLDS
jgi:hypothetical protein